MCTHQSGSFRITELSWSSLLQIGFAGLCLSSLYLIYKMTNSEDFYSRGQCSKKCVPGGNSSHISECYLNRNYFADDPEFNELVHKVEEAIDAGVYPARISAGSSGSYFAKNPEGESIGVFKPKNEEPYGPKNPKWTKKFQKIFCPFCFGRGPLFDNQGYLSEAGATVVDEMLDLKIVPKTKVVWLASPTFNYNSIDRTKFRIVNSLPKFANSFQINSLPPKIGSLQVMVKDYKDAATFFSDYDIENAIDSIKKNFQHQFERLVCLDYIIRNTDRGLDNWLVKIDEPNSSNEVKSSAVKIAAFDNGLAFPFKHPDEWRSYPFGWADLKQAKEPFSDEIRKLVLPRLEKVEFVEELCEELNKLFEVDKEFKLVNFEKQMSIMRGQITNLIMALQEKKTPLELAEMKPTIVKRSAEKTPRKQKSGWSDYSKSHQENEPIFSKI